MIGDGFGIDLRRMEDATRIRAARTAMLSKAGGNFDYIPELAVDTDLALDVGVGKVAEMRRDEVLERTGGGDGYGDARRCAELEFLAIPEL